MTDQIGENDELEICSECNGTAYGPNMEFYESYIPKDELLEAGFYYCRRCGLAGKIDWISNAMRSKHFDQRFLSDCKLYDTVISNYIVLGHMLKAPDFKINKDSFYNDSRHEHFEEYDSLIDSIADDSDDTLAYFLNEEVFGDFSDMMTWSVEEMTEGLDISLNTIRWLEDSIKYTATSDLSKNGYRMSH